MDSIESQVRGMIKSVLTVVDTLVVSTVRFGTWEISSLLDVRAGLSRSDRARRTNRGCTELVARHLVLVAGQFNSVHVSAELLRRL